MSVLPLLFYILIIFYNMENRPTMKDPAEFAIIRSMYFKDTHISDKLDPIEELDRMEAKQRNQSKSSR